MRPPKSIVSLAAAVCAFADCNSHAQTNDVTFTMMMTSQATFTLGGTNPIGTATVKTSVVNTAALINELGLALNETPAFSKSAKLVAIEGDQAPQFAVVDGTNFVLIATNILSLNQVDGNSVISGKSDNTNSLAAPKLTDLVILELDFNDVGLGQGNNLQFYLRGLATLTTTDTTPKSNAYTETSSAKISSMTGDGTMGTNSTPFVATGSLSGGGKSSLTLPPPT